MRYIPSLAEWLLTHVSVPTMRALHRLTAPIPFPVAEPLAAGVMGLALAGVVRAVFVRRFPRGLLKGLLALGLALALLWGPALAVPVDDLPAPDAGALAWLCGNLIHALNESPLAFPADALEAASAVAGLPGGAVKAARWPGWMALAGAWGMFIPLTGEALVDPAEPTPLVPFTAVHELMHLAGIADEGAANVAAWARCMAAGGPFADSARLWALRYAMGRLRAQDEAAWWEMRARMKGELKRAFLDCGGEAEVPSRGFTPARGDYAALATRLAGGD